MLLARRLGPGSRVAACSSLLLHAVVSGLSDELPEARRLPSISAMKAGEKKDSRSVCDDAGLEIEDLDDLARSVKGNSLGTVMVARRKLLSDRGVSTTSGASRLSLALM